MALREPIVLSSDVGSQTFYSTTGDIQESYTQVKPLPTEGKGTLWVAYTVTNWDHDHPADNPARVIEPNSPIINMAAPIKSLQGFNVENLGIILFEHIGFRGYGESNTNSVPFLKDFPQGEIGGVSSIIITGGRWTLYTGYNYTGTTMRIHGKEVLEPAMYEFVGGSVNDKAKSVKYVGSSS